MNQRTPVLSVVDYAAWDKGYMPPSEHILIDKLAYRGARVVFSTAVSRENQIWVVVEGPALSPVARRMVREFANLWFDDLPSSEPYEYETPWC